MTIKETIKKGMIELKTNGIEEPNLKSRLLMQYILNKPRQYLLVHDNETLTLRQEVNYFKGIKRLIERIPIQHITHMQEFMKMNFFVNEDVLIPRPDTETLVEEVISIVLDNATYPSLINKCKENIRLMYRKWCNSYITC